MYRTLFSSPHGDCYFGRTMDFSYPLAPQLYMLPKGYTWNNQANTHTIQNLYTVLGIGQNIHPVILADGVNDRGFAPLHSIFPDMQFMTPSPKKAKEKFPSPHSSLLIFLLDSAPAFHRQPRF